MPLSRRMPNFLFFTSAAYVPDLRERRPTPASEALTVD
jgi:hypothetical protein